MFKLVYFSIYIYRCMHSTTQFNEISKHILAVLLINTSPDIFVYL